MYTFCPRQITDRYYKLGSSVDITCQVAISYLSTLPPSMMSNSNANAYQYQMMTTTTSTTTTVFPFIDTNLIRRNFQPSIPYTGNHIIKWQKDGKELPKDIKINLRLVQQRSSLYTIYLYFLSHHNIVTICPLLLLLFSTQMNFKWKLSFSIEFTTPRYLRLINFTMNNSSE